MTTPLCKYPPCGREIIQGQYGAEGDEPFKERLESGYCRAKCKRLDKPSPSPKDRPTLVADPTTWNHSRPEGKEQPKERRINDPAYERWIRERFCIVPGCYNDAQSHHQNEQGHGGKSTKPSSYRCIPLCTEHHTLGGTPYLRGSYHGMGKLTGWKFWKHYGIDVETVIHDLNRAYLESGRKFKEG